MSVLMTDSAETVSQVAHPTGPRSERRECSTSTDPGDDYLQLGHLNGPPRESAVSAQAPLVPPKTRSGRQSSQLGHPNGAPREECGRLIRFSPALTGEFDDGLSAGPPKGAPR